MDKNTKAAIYFTARRRDVGVAYLLALTVFLGLFGAHRFYLGRNGTAIIMLILSLIGTGFLFAGFMVLGLTVLGLTALGLTALGIEGSDHGASESTAPESIAPGPALSDSMSVDPLNFGLVVIAVMIICLIATTVWLIIDMFLIPGMVRACNRALMEEAQGGGTL